MCLSSMTRSKATIPPSLKPLNLKLSSVTSNKLLLEPYSGPFVDHLSRNDDASCSGRKRIQQPQAKDHLYCENQKVAQTQRDPPRDNNPCLYFPVYANSAFHISVSFPQAE